MSFSPIFALVFAFRFGRDVSFFEICYSENANKYKLKYNLSQTVDKAPSYEGAFLVS